MVRDQVCSCRRVKSPSFRSKNMVGYILEVVTRDELEEIRFRPRSGVRLLACGLLYRFDVLLLSF